TWLFIFQSSHLLCQNDQITAISSYASQDILGETPVERPVTCKNNFCHRLATSCRVIVKNRADSSFLLYQAHMFEVERTSPSLLWFWAFVLLSVKTACNGLKLSDNSIIHPF